MTVTLVTLLSIFSFAAGERHAAVFQRRKIEVEQGSDVSLPCRLDPPVNLTDKTVDWLRPDLNKGVVHARRHGQYHDDQMDQYRNRTTLSLDGLSRGDLTLQMFSVQPSDSGLYKGYVSKLKAWCLIQLTVVSKGHQNRTKMEGSSTPAPPVGNMTERDDHDVAENWAAWKTVACVGGVAAAVVVVVAVVLILVKTGKIQICKKTPPNQFEMNNPHSAAENGALMVGDDLNRNP